MKTKSRSHQGIRKSKRRETLDSISSARIESHEEAPFFESPNKYPSKSSKPSRLIYGIIFLSFFAGIGFNAFWPTVNKLTTKVPLIGAFGFKPRPADFPAVAHLFLHDNSISSGKSASRDAKAVRPDILSKVKITRERPVKMLDFDFASRKAAWSASDRTGPGDFVRVPFIIKNESKATCFTCPAEGSVPFPAGELKSAQIVKIQDSNSREIPFQSRVLAEWPDGSIKWLNIMFEVSLNPGQGKGYFLEYGPGIKTPDYPSVLKVSEDENSIFVNTGKMEVVWSKSRFFLYDRVLLDQDKNAIMEPAEEVLSGARLYLQAKGKNFWADLDSKTYRIEIEETGNGRAIIKAQGWFQAQDGERYCQAIVRYYVYQGKNFIKTSHTLIYTGYPANPYNPEYKTMKLPENETIQAFGIKMPFDFTSDAKVKIGLEKRGQQEIQDAQNIKLIQNGYEQAVLDKDRQIIETGDMISGWFDISNQDYGIGLGVRNFRENFPKAFRTEREEKEIQVDLWPVEAGEINFATTTKAVDPSQPALGQAFGLAKTHELVFYFHKNDSTAASSSDVVSSLMKPVIIRTNPYWVDATGVFGRLLPVSIRYAPEEKMLSRLFDWAARQPKEYKWYGMFNFGDTLSWWRRGDGNKGIEEFGWYPQGKWGWFQNGMTGLHAGALLQYMRSGEWKYFEFAENAVRHVMDVDTIHYNTIANDSRLKDVLNDWRSQIGSMHESNGDHWGGFSEDASYTNLVGILNYYFITGNERALDVAREIGEFYLSQPFLSTKHRTRVPHRALANTLWGEVLLYEATGDARYKQAADKIIEIYLQGQQPDGSFLEFFEPFEEKWSGKKNRFYMSAYAVGAFISYHRLTQDKDVETMLLKLVDYLGAMSERQYILHGFAYAYFLTKNAKYIDLAERGLNDLRSTQQFSSDPMLDGMIDKKPTYHQVSLLLYAVPYAFEALELSRR
jgi:hypothetical protein